MPRPVTPDLLRHAPLFATLPDQALAEVAASATLISRPATARIFEEGSAAQCCYLLTSGRGKIVVAGADGSEITISIVDPVGLVGELALIDSMPRSAGFVAVDDCRLVEIQRRTFLALRQHRPFEDQLLIHVAATLRRATEQLRAIYTFDAVERVAWCIARMAGAGGRSLGNEIVLSPRPSHRELAEMTGSSRETVSRALLRLRKMRWLRWDRTAFYITTRAVSRYLGERTAADHTAAQALDLRAV